MASYRPRPTAVSASYKCIRGEREGLVQVLNENAYSMAEYNKRTGRFIWMRFLPITQREAVEGWVRSQFAPPMLGPSKVTGPTVRAAKAG
jgi:hypothetical protein